MCLNGKSSVIAGNRKICLQKNGKNDKEIDEQKKTIKKSTPSPHIRTTKQGRLEREKDVRCIERLTGEGSGDLDRRTE